MGGPRIKPEAVTVRGLCVKCGVNLQQAKGHGKYRAHCRKCHTVRYGMPNWAPEPHRKFKKDHCEKCGFIPVTMFQLDVDHIDGNHANNDPKNLMTLCANCHRLKTFLERGGVL